MRAKKVGRNFKADLLITITLVFIGFFSRQIFLKSMGGEMTGLMLLLTQVLGFLNLAELGIGVAAASLLYAPLANGDRRKINEILSTLKFVYCWIMAGILIFGLIIGIFLQENIASVSAIDHSFYYWCIYVCNTAFTYTYAHKSILITADQNFSIVRIIQGGSKIVVNLLQMLLIVIYKNFFLYLAIETLFVIFQYIVFQLIANKHYPWLEKVNVTEKAVFHKVKNVFFHKVGTVLNNNTSYLLVSKFLSLSYVTIYSSYLMVFQSVTMMMNIASNSLTASLGNYLHTKKHELFQLWGGFYTFFYFVASVVCSVSYFTIDDFIANWIGAEYVLSNDILLLILVSVFLNIVRIPTDIVKNATGYFSDIHLPLLEGAVNLALSFILIKIIGLKGVVIGAIVASFIFIFMAKPFYLLRHHFQEKFKHYFIMIFPGVWRAGLSLGICGGIFHTYPVTLSATGWLNWLIFTTVVSLLILLINIVVFSTNSQFRHLITRLLRVVFNKI